MSLALLAAFPAKAQFAPAPFVLGGEYQFESDLDDGGSFSRSTAGLQASALLSRADETLIALSAGYQFETYNFQNLLVDPWEDIHRVQLGLFLKSKLANGWNWMLLPSVAVQAESGADWGEALIYGGIGGAWYDYSDDLSLGFGFGVRSKLEDSVSVFPIIFLDWQITSSLALTTAPPEGLWVGPGISLRWDACEKVSYALIFQYQSDQFRLDEDSRASADGIGELRQSRVALAATYEVSENFRVTGTAGVALGGELELQNSRGDELSETDFDPALVIGVEAALRF